MGRHGLIKESQGNTKSQFFPENRCGQTMIGAYPTPGDHPLSILGKGLSQEELQFSRFIPTIF